MDFSVRLGLGQKLPGLENSLFQLLVSPKNLTYARKENLATNASPLAKQKQKLTVKYFEGKSATAAARIGNTKTTSPLRPPS